MNTTTTTKENNMETTTEITARVMAKVGLGSKYVGKLRLSDRIITEIGDGLVDLMEVPCEWVSACGQYGPCVDWLEVSPEDWAALCDAEEMGR
jgi:hypothetical protein